MANAVEKLFDATLPKLDTESARRVADWPELPEELDLEPSFPLDVDDADLRPYRDIEIAERVFDRIADRGSTVPGLPQDEGELIEGGIRERGFEAIAFYKSYRFLNQNPFPGKWGIFYLRQGLTQVAWEIGAYYPGYGDPRKLAHGFLYAHEHFHYRSDIQILMFEAIAQKHLYIPLRRALRGRETHFVEEALANKNVLDWSCRSSIGLKEYAIDFMLLQPNAYARFSEPLDSLSGEWAANVLDLLPPGCPPRNDVSPWVGATPKDLLRKSLCPEYVIHPHRLSNWISPAWVPPPVLKIVEGEKLAKLLKSKYVDLTQKWEETKAKLIENRMLRGLNFKKWPKEGKDAYSVRVDDNFRAHLKHQGNGAWLAYVIGPHKKMGHG